LSEINYVICVPVYKVTEKVKRCFNSLKNMNVLIIDNTGKRECEIFEGYGFEIQYQSENIGVPKAWNIGLKKGCDWTFITSSSMMFYKNFSHVLNMIKDYDKLMFRTGFDWHFLGIHKGAVEKIGYFDENFYPGYFENTDWDYRCYLANIYEPKMHKIDAICQADHECLSNGLTFNHYKLHDYLTSKWGEDNKDINWGVGHWGQYRHPFNDPTKTIDYWESATVEELAERYKQ
jgi:hypothetical protein